MKIIFVKDKSFLPEVIGYKEYAESQGLVLDTVLKKDFSADLLSRYDVVWHCCGLEISPKRQIFKIHEYQSSSLPPFASIKDFIKKSINSRPDARVFLNNFVYEKFNFKNQVPSFYRDMGVHKSFLNRDDHGSHKNYKFVYIGSTVNARNFEQVYNSINKTGYKMIVVGEKPAYLKNNSNSRIEFTGRVNYLDVAKLASEAEFGLNYIPNVQPFSNQTSTKLLEYCALGLKIITNLHQPSLDFEKRMSGSFFKIKDNFSNMKGFEEYNYVTPRVDEYEWSKIIESSKIFDHLVTIDFS